MNKYQKIPTIAALIAFSAIIAPSAHGQEVRRAILPSEIDYYQNRFDTEWKQLTAQWKVLDSQALVVIAQIQSQGNTVQRAQLLISIWDQMDQIARRQDEMLAAAKRDTPRLIDMDKALKEAAWAQMQADQRRAPVILPRDPNPNDCLIIATEAFNRLQKTSNWARIAGLRFIAEGKIARHAVVFFQPTPDSKIWMYDASGSIDLDTQSHDLEQITPALKSLVTNLESVEWQ
jgi:hypothetical protein